MQPKLSSLSDKKLELDLQSPQLALFQICETLNNSQPDKTRPHMAHKNFSSAKQ